MYINYIFKTNEYRRFKELHDAEMAEKLLAREGLDSMTLSSDDFFKFYLGLLGAYKTPAKG